MGSRLERIGWCDNCQAPEDGSPGFRAGLLVKVGEIEREVDLCADCTETMFAELLDELGRIGREPERRRKAKAEPAPVAAKPARQPRSTSDPSERQHCDLCDKQPASLGGLKQHVKVWHGLRWTEYAAGARPTRGVEQPGLEGVA